MTIQEFHQKVEEDISRLEELGEQLGEPGLYRKSVDEQTNYEHLTLIVEEIGELASCFQSGDLLEKHLYNQLLKIAGMIAEWAIRLQIQEN